MKTLRQKLLVLLVALMVACISISFISAFKPVMADETNLFIMEGGVQASTKVDGLRFRVKMGENVYARIVTNDVNEEVSLSVLIAPVDNFVNHDGEDYINLAKKVKIDFEDETKIYRKADGFYYANAVLTNLNAENNANINNSQFEIMFSAIGVIEDNGSYEYASFIDGDIQNHTNSQYEVLQSAVLDVEDTDNDYAESILGEDSPYKGWFGSENYPIVIDTQDKYDALVSKNLTTDAYIKVENNGFEIDKNELPGNATVYHTVKFYNGETLLDTVEVVDGQEVVFAGATPEKSGYRFSAHDDEERGIVSGIFYYEFDKWVTANNGEVEADLSAVTNNASVYASFKEVDKSIEMLAEASLANPSVACFWDELFGFKQLNQNPSGSGESTYVSQCRGYSTNIKYGDEKGSTSYVRVGQNNKGLYLGYTIAPHFDRAAAAGKYIVFQVYLETIGDTDAYGQVRLNGMGGKAIRVDTGRWATVIFSADDFMASTYVSIYAWNCAANQDVKYYFSRAYVVDASDVMADLCAIADNATYTLGDGDVELVGKINKYVWGSTWRDTDLTHLLPGSLAPAYIDGAMMLYQNTAGNRCIGIDFAKAYSGKIYMTARNLGTDSKVPYMQVFTEHEVASTHSGSPDGKLVKELDNGFAVWEFNLGSSAITYVRFYLNAPAGCQVLITNISTVAPAA